MHTEDDVRVQVEDALSRFGLDLTLREVAERFGTSEEDALAMRRLSRDLPAASRRVGLFARAVISVLLATPHPAIEVASKQKYW
jgi:hypothetical protein